MSSPIDNKLREVAELHDELLRAWTILVLPFLFFFHIGLILFEAGAVHQQQSFHTLQIARYLIILAICGVTFFAAGFGFSQNAEGGVFGDSHFFGIGYTEKDYQQWSYFYSLCSAMCLLSTSTLTERISLETHLFFAFLNCALIFPLIQAWTLHGGWLVEMGFLDKAEIGVFHLASGVIGFVGCIYCGPRSGLFSCKFQKEQYMLVDINSRKDGFPEGANQDIGSEDLSCKSPQIDTTKKPVEAFLEHGSEQDTLMENYSRFFLFVKQLTGQLLSSDEKLLTPEHITMLQSQQNSILGRAPLIQALPAKIEEEAKEEQSSASEQEQETIDFPQPTDCAEAQGDKIRTEEDALKFSGGNNQPSPILSAGQNVKSVEFSQILPMIDEEEENLIGQDAEQNRLGLHLPENASSQPKTQHNQSLSSPSSFRIKSFTMKQPNNEQSAFIEKKQISPANTTRHKHNPLSERSREDLVLAKKRSSFRSFSMMKEDLKRRMSLTQGHSQPLFPNLENGAFSRRKKLDAYAQSQRRNSFLQSQLLPSRKHSIPNLTFPSPEEKQVWDAIVSDINRDLDRIKSQELQRRNRIGSLACNLKATNLLSIPSLNSQNGLQAIVLKEQAWKRLLTFPLQPNAPGQGGSNGPFAPGMPNPPPLQPQGQQLSFFKRIRQNSLAPASVLRQSRRSSMFGDAFLKSKQSESRLSRVIPESNLESPLPTLAQRQDSTYFRKEEAEEIEPNTADSLRPVRLRQASVALSQSEHQILDQINKLLEIQNLKSQNKHLQSQGLSTQAEEVQRSISKLREEEEENGNQGESLEIIDEHQEPMHVSDKSGSLSSYTVQDTSQKLVEASKELKPKAADQKKNPLFRLSSKKIEFSAHFGDLSLPEEELAGEEFIQPTRKMSARIPESSKDKNPLARRSSSERIIGTPSTRGLDSQITVATPTSAVGPHSQTMFEDEAHHTQDEVVDYLAASIKTFKADFGEFNSLPKEKILALFYLYQRMHAARKFGVQDPTFLAGGALLMFIFQLGLNCGMGNALLTIDSSEEISFTEIPLILVNTLMSSAAGVILVVIVQQSQNFLSTNLQESSGLAKSHELIALCNGLLAGSISISAGCHHFTPLSSLFIGCVGSGLYYSFRGLLIKFEVDDPMEVTKVHGICAFWGLLAAGLFDDEEGFITTGSVELLAIQLFGGICIIAYSGLVAAIFFSILNSLGRLRIRNFYQVTGLDEALSVVGSNLMKKANLYH